MRIRHARLTMALATLRPKHWVVLTAMGVSAVLLHFLLCGWSFAGPINGTEIYVVGRFANPQGGSPLFGYGLFAKSTVGATLAILFGILLPINLVLGMFYLVFSVRDAARSKTACCRHCGHQLAPNRCPECGKA